MKECKTCEEIERLKKHQKELYNYKIFVDLVQYGWVKGKIKRKGTQSSTGIVGVFDLNYCPTCGKKL